MAKIGEDGAFVEMAMYNIRSFQKINRPIFVYYENTESVMHNKAILTDVLERRKAALAEAAYFQARDVEYDAEEGFVWQVAANLKRICAEEKYGTVSNFMEQEIVPILNDRPDIHFYKERWSTIEAWQTQPKRFWLRCKLVVGIPLTIKKASLGVPGIRRVTNYLFSRFYRGFRKIRKTDSAIFLTGEKNVCRIKHEIGS